MGRGMTSARPTAARDTFPDLPGQLSNPRLPSGAAMRCPECQRFQHPDDTTCSLERAVIARAAEGSGFWKARP
jgi:hypothetical protein